MGTVGSLYNSFWQGYGYEYHSSGLAHGGRAEARGRLPGRLVGAAGRRAELGEGQIGSALTGVTAFLFCFDRGTFWVLPLAYFYLPKSARAYLLDPHLSNFIPFAAAPLVLTNLSASKERAARGGRATGRGAPPAAVPRQGSGGHLSLGHFASREFYVFPFNFCKHFPTFFHGKVTKTSIVEYCGDLRRRRTHARAAQGSTKSHGSRNSPHLYITYYTISDVYIYIYIYINDVHTVYTVYFIIIIIIIIIIMLCYYELYIIVYAYP